MNRQNNTYFSSSPVSEEKPITILLVDDHTMMREGTRKLLEEDSSLSIVGEAQNGEEAIAYYEQYQPDVVVLDIAMKGMNGFGVVRTLLAQAKHPPTILVLTAYDEIAYVQTMLKLGVKGYWLKSAYGSQIRQAVHDVVAGKQSLAPEIRRLLREERENSITPVEPLTNREIAVLRVVAQGYRNGEIAQKLSISIKTVETHLTSIYGKLGVQSRAELIALAQKQGLLLEE